MLDTYVAFDPSELGFCYSRKTKVEARQANQLMADEARRIAANIARLPELLGKVDKKGARPCLDLRLDTWPRSAQKPAQGAVVAILARFRAEGALGSGDGRYRMPTPLASETCLPLNFILYRQNNRYAQMGKWKRCIHVRFLFPRLLHFQSLKRSWPLAYRSGLALDAFQTARQ
jgi:hypothetical protein